MKLLKYIFCPNWKLMYHLHGTWTIDVEPSISWLHYVKEDVCDFHIYYSEIRNKYKLVMSGYKPKHHHRYQNAIEALIDLQNK